MLQARVVIRVFQVTYWPNLDVRDGSEIKLGAFGDLRLGKRYALGLIARTSGAADEVARVGRLAKHIVESPYKALREKYEEIWNSPNPADSLERCIARRHTSLVFSAPERIEKTTSVVDFQENAEVAKTWCMDDLRPILRARYTRWMGLAESPPSNGREPREQFAELDDQQPEAPQRAVG